jgi:hypothetical protein
MTHPPKDLFLTVCAVSVVPQKKLSTLGHSGLDQACPVLDTGESSILGLDCRWSLLRNESKIQAGYS